MLGDTLGMHWYGQIKYDYDCGLTFWFIYTYWILNISCSKATTLERTYGPAWIAYGHSFAVESEHDQAMAAYFTAAQLMKG